MVGKHIVALSPSWESRCSRHSSKALPLWRGGGRLMGSIYQRLFTEREGFHQQFRHISGEHRGWVLLRDTVDPNILAARSLLQILALILTISWVKCSTLAILLVTISSVQVVRDCSISTTVLFSRAKFCCIADVLEDNSLLKASSSVLMEEMFSVLNIQ